MRGLEPKAYSMHEERKCACSSLFWIPQDTRWF